MTHEEGTHIPITSEDCFRYTSLHRHFSIKAALPGLFCPCSLSVSLLLTLIASSSPQVLTICKFARLSTFTTKVHLFELTFIFSLPPLNCSVLSFSEWLARFSFG
jgi:hypothetical protein